MNDLSRLVAIGDVHGELEGFQEILFAENLIDSQKKWSGGKTVLLQIGDVVDRGPYSLEVFAYLKELQNQAEAAQGRVIRILGNHELMVLQGLYYYCNYSHPEVLAREIRIDILSGKIQTAFAWQGRLYAHAGIRLGILERLLKDMNISDPRGWVADYGALAAHLNKTVQEAVQNNDYQNSIFWVDTARGGRDPVGGVFWSDFRDLVREEINPIRQVVGHTPVFKPKAKIYWTEDKTKINIDAGMYAGYGGHRAWIVVDGEHLYAKELSKGKVISETIE